MNKNTLKHKIFKNIIFLSISIILFFSILFSYFLYTSGINNAKKVIKQRNIAITYFISSYFTKFYNSIKMLSKNRKVILGAWINEEDKRDVLELYDTLEQIDPDINYVYSGYINKYLLISDYVPPPGYNPTIRPWYIAALKSAPKISNGIPYREIKTKEWLISISKVLIDNNNRITGVIAIDTAITKIEQFLNEKFGNFKTSESFIVKTNGDVITFGKIKSYNFFKNKIINFKKKNGNFSFIKNGIEYLAYYNYLENLGWIIVTTLNKDEILSPIFKKIGLSFFLILLITLLISSSLSNSLSKEIIIPLNNLTSRIENILNNKSCDWSNYKYPSNEIGKIFGYIEQLTTDALYKKNIELMELNKKLKELSTIDPLTKLFNRRKMNEEIDKEYKRSIRYNKKFSLILFDIDHFKKINDTYGHNTGDIVLKEISRLSKEVLRKTDIISRWGGEEFLILSPETNKKNAKIIAEKLRKSVESYKFAGFLKVTISLGIAEFYNNEGNIEDLINEADEKLYIAKKSGRNKSVS